MRFSLRVRLLWARLRQGSREQVEQAITACRALLPQPVKVRS